MIKGFLKKHDRPGKNETRANPTVLSGSFEIDQIFLPAFQGNVQALLAELGGVRNA